MSKLILIAAIAENGVIGDGNALPWGRSLPRDMARFKDVTTKAGCILMGRKTAESLRAPLKHRRNLVLSRSGAALPEGFEVFSELKSAVAAACDSKVIAVIGGAEIYALCAPYTSLAYITRVRRAFLGDAHYPFASLDSYTRKGDVIAHPRDAENAYAMQFITLQNNDVQPL